MKKSFIKTLKDMTKWQRRFILLIMFNIILIVSFFTFLLMTPPTSDQLPESSYIEERGARFKVETTKQDLNELINTYIDDVLKTDQANFDVIVDDNVKLIGELFAFGVPIPLNVTMDPVVMENGDLVLKMNELSLGLLNLPRGRILHYINRQVETPDWLYFDSENEQIYIAVTSIEVESNIRFKVESLDLSTDVIVFTFNVPSGSTANITPSE
ncbi:Uncharacterized protein YpmS [Halolactibacillus alkaliphilus]|nr:Uncharacterized protein YpmS [Halolactibacillus alkaliphilus]